MSRLIEGGATFCILTIATRGRGANRLKSPFPFVNQAPCQFRPGPEVAAGIERRNASPLTLLTGSAPPIAPELRQMLEPVDCMQSFRSGLESATSLLRGAAHAAVTKITAESRNLFRAEAITKCPPKPKVHYAFRIPTSQRRLTPRSTVKMRPNPSLNRTRAGGLSPARRSPVSLLR